MSQNELPLTSNRLEIKNPFRLFGLIQVLTGLVLGILLVLRAPVLLPVFKDFFEFFQRNPERALNRPEGIVFLILSFFCLWAVILCLVNLIQGIMNLFVFFVPAGVPKEITAFNEVVPKLFVDRIITSYTQPGLALRMAAALISKRLLYTTASQRKLVESLLPLGIKWLVIIALALGISAPAGCLFLLLAAGVFALLATLFAVVAYIPPMPDVQVAEMRDHLVNSGNPINFFHHAQNSLDQIRHGNFPNRKLYDSPPELGRTNRGETDNFQGQVLVEVQPLPIEQGLSNSAVILDVGGAFLRCAGYGILLFSFPLQGEAGILTLAMRLATGFIVLRNGTQLLKQGLKLHSVYRFTSDLIWIKLTGTCTASGIGLGDGRGGQFFSQRVVMQSDTYLHTYGARIVTECVGLEAGRIIVDAQQTADFQDKFNQMRNSLLAFQDSGSKLANIDLTTPGLSNVVQANAEIAVMQARAAAALPPSPLPPQITQAAAPPAPAPPPVPVSPQTTPDTKVCPDCGEQVKFVARKCRFCGYLFNQT